MASRDFAADVRRVETIEVVRLASPRVLVG